MKRVIDVVGAAAGLVVLSPVLALVHVLVRLDSPGGSLYRQRRVGRHGREFHILKFRTMRVDTPGAAVTTAHDPRITRVGSWLRATKLDELPQLVNVLRGEMSMVGPRPEVPEYVAAWPEDQARLILSVRPGMTDPASLEFRREAELLSQVADPEDYYVTTVMPRKLELYAAYVSNRSTLGDFRIIARTVAAVLGR